MGFFDLFKSKPKLCQTCHKEFKKLHKYNSVYSRQKEANFPKMICTDCLLAAFKRDLANFKGRILFQEPITDDCYCFVKFVDEPNKVLIVEPAMTLLASDGTSCAKCGSPARFTWATGHIVDDDQKVYAYKTRDQFSQYQYLCDQHLLEEFAAWTDQNKFFYGEFWPPRGNEEGYCY